MVGEEAPVVGEPQRRGLDLERGAAEGQVRAEPSQLLLAHRMEPQLVEELEQPRAPGSELAA